jgi:thiaminase/transcriptional activator TenA
MMKNSYSDKLKREASEIWEKIFTHPYLIDMRNGTLSLNKFIYYIRQDYAYLMDFARCLSLATAKAEDIETMRIFSNLLDGCLNEEVERLEQLSESLEIPIEDLRATELAPANLAYTRHLLHVGYSGTMGEITAALLPCMWIYQIIGENLMQSSMLKDKSIYVDWVKIYSSESYADLVTWYREMTDKSAEVSGPAVKERMRRHFVLSSKYEYLFWEMAYREEEW